MKKISYFDKMRILVVTEFAALAVIIVMLVMDLNDCFLLDERGKILMSIMLVGAAIGLFVMIAKTVFEIPQYYKNICERFTQGEIYQEFIDNIGTLFPGLDDAVGRLDGLIDRQKVIQLSTKQAELLALQNQINPHFLYNTLDAIRGDALCIGADNIADITEALSTFFRYTITDTKSLVTLQAELDNVENYFKIQRYRFGEKLSLEVRLRDKEEFLMQLHCPKLTLQPIVENAIFHGIEKKSESGLISIEIEIVDKELHIDITDNGLGMEENALIRLNEQLARASIGYIVEDEKKKKGGIALKNVCRRIKLLFGEEYGLHINSISGVGTKVEMVLPIVTGNREK